MSFLDKDKDKDKPLDKDKDKEHAKEHAKQHPPMAPGPVGPPPEPPPPITNTPPITPAPTVARTPDWWMTYNAATSGMWANQSYASLGRAYVHSQAAAAADEAHADDEPEEPLP